MDVNNPSNYGFLFTVETNGAMQWRTSEAANQYRQAKADADTAFLNMRQAVTNAYVGLQIANRELLDEQAAFADAERIRDLTKKQFEQGAAPQTNAIRADIARTQELANLLTQINAVKAARSALNIALGRKPELPVDASEELQKYIPIHLSLDDLQKQAADHRTELESAQFNLSALKAAVGLARSQYYPDLFVATDLREVKSGVFQVGFTMPLFDFGSIHGAVKQAQKNAKAQESQITLQQQQVRLDVESAYEAMTLAEGTVEALQTGSLSQAEDLETRIEKGYRLGGNTILDLLDAQSTLRAARISLPRRHRRLPPSPIPGTRHRPISPGPKHPWSAVRHSLPKGPGRQSPVPSSPFWRRQPFAPSGESAREAPSPFRGRGWGEGALTMAKSPLRAQREIVSNKKLGSTQRQSAPVRVRKNINPIPGVDMTVALSLGCRMRRPLFERSEFGRRDSPRRISEGPGHGTGLRAPKPQAKEQWPSGKRLKSSECILQDSGQADTAPTPQTEG